MEHLALTGDRLKRGFAAGSSLSFRRHSCCHFLCMINLFDLYEKMEFGPSMFSKVYSLAERNAVDGSSLASPPPVKAAGQERQEYCVSLSLEE